MDQSRSESSTTQQQNVHLHMHHVCNCQGSIYPPTYYPAVGYRTPLPQLMPFAAPTAVARPYLQHYQYTQFNMGSQYTVPLTHVTPQSGTVYGNITPTPASSTEVIFSTSQRDRRDRTEIQEDVGDADRVHEPPLGYEYNQVTPPANELLLTDNSESGSTENFVKFLERSCLTAEQIAYRNRNRPCFRNIQNLCIRTRSEILKPCTTISNIHSQGIPWATKDFIYAFVRLTNCWHILKGYWENRDGSSLGKIEKELTPEFRACYVRWEKETIDLAAQLTRVFYNLDTNLNCPTNVTAHTTNNLIPPQVNILKTSASENAIKKPTESETVTTSTLTSSSLNNSSKNVRGILHLPSTAPTETVDQGNQTCAGDFYKDEELGSEEDDRRIYMKPGSYCVPKKSSSDTMGNQNSPRAIEFLETAQNVNKARDSVNDKYWMNVHIGKKSIGNLEPITQEDVDSTEAVDMELNLSSQLSVHEWLINNNFSQFGETASQAQPQEMRPFFMDSAVQYEAISTIDDVQQKTPITLLQRTKNANSIGSKPQKIANGNGRIEITSRTYRKRTETQNRTGTIGLRKNSTLYESKNGITELAAAILEKILLDIMDGFLGDGLLVEVKVCNEFTPIIDVETILKKIRTYDYIYVNEAVRDIRYLINYSAYFSEHLENKADVLRHKIEILLTENLPGYDFQDIKGDLNEKVGPLKFKKNFDTDPEYI